MEQVKNLKIKKKAVNLLLKGIVLAGLLSGCKTGNILSSESSSKLFAPGEHYVTVVEPYDGQLKLLIEPGYEIVNITHQQGNMGEEQVITYRNIDSVLCTIYQSVGSGKEDFNTFGEPLGMGEALNYEPLSTSLPVK